MKELEQECESQDVGGGAAGVKRKPGPAAEAQHRLGLDRATPRARLIAHPDEWLNEIHTAK